ncbi:MAG: hypothetical protein COB93_11975 [Sneathiella sp.]|nr:MAG: hypothetical protein COB93_11975 [Sneathiella sp.]
MFQLHSRLNADTTLILSLDVCQILLMNDSRFPWIILVPARPDLKEIHDLSSEDYTKVMAETLKCSEVMAALFGADKMNMAALGNMVPQLHIHIIARFKDDAAWPAPVWGVGDAIPYTASDLEKRSTLIGNALSAL